MERELYTETEECREARLLLMLSDAPRYTKLRLRVYRLELLHKDNPTDKLTKDVLEEARVNIQWYIAQKRVELL